MKCFKHESVEAVAVCVHCGRAVCRDCAPAKSIERIVCSDTCGRALEQNAKAIQMLLDKSTQSAKASAFYCYLTSGLSAAAAVAAWFMMPAPFLIYFTAACAVVLFAAGFWYSRTAKG